MDKFVLGETVEIKIHPRGGCRRDYKCLGMCSEMVKLIGKKGVIIEIEKHRNTKHYKLDISPYWFTKCMLK